MKKNRVLVGSLEDHKYQLNYYQAKYQEIDINALHQKVCLLTTQAEFLKNINQAQAKKITKISAKAMNLLKQMNTKKKFSSPR